MYELHLIHERRENELINTTVYIDKEQFSKRLQVLFEKRECKAVELEMALKVGRATVSRWRNGWTLPNDSQVKEIARFFNVRYEWLVGRDEYMTVKDIPFRSLTKTNIRRANYFESLGYKIEIGTTKYETDEDGVASVVGGTWLITRDGITTEIDDQELLELEKEVESFIDYKMGQFFSRKE